MPDSLPRLTPEQKREIRQCLEADAPLPESYRFLLFGESRAPELVWPGKGRIAPARPCSLELLERLAPHAVGNAWQNMLILGDNRDILNALASGPWREKIENAGGLKLIYIDPPFNAGRDFFAGGKRELAYSDGDCLTSYLNLIHERLILMRGLLAPDGCIYAHSDWRVSACLRLLLDEIFGFHVNEIIWHYTGGGRSRKRFSRKHDSILVYSRQGSFTFNPDAIRMPYAKTSGYAKSGITAKSGKRYLPNPLGSIPDDVWHIPIINPLSAERTGYPTQKPEALIKRILLASCRPGDLCADFYCGSGVLPAVASKLGRKWIAADMSPVAIKYSRARLLRLLEEGQGGFDILKVSAQ